MSLRPVSEVEAPQIVTKFYYGEKGLCYDLMLRSVQGVLQEIGTYSEYTDYKSAFNELSNTVEREALTLTTRQIKKSA